MSPSLHYPVLEGFASGTENRRAPQPLGCIIVTGIKGIDCRVRNDVNPTNQSGHLVTPDLSAGIGIAKRIAGAMGIVVQVRVPELNHRKQGHAWDFEKHRASRRMLMGRAFASRGDNARCSFSAFAAKLDDSFILGTIASKHWLENWESVPCR